MSESTVSLNSPKLSNCSILTLKIVVKRFELWRASHNWLQSSIFSLKHPTMKLALKFLTIEKNKHTPNENIQLITIDIMLNEFFPREL